jgi:addiction module HigA family antidote
MARKAQPLFTLETPGQILKKHVIEAHGITQDALATAMGVSRLTVNQLINDKRSITAETALRLSRVLSTTPEFWLNLQRDQDLARAKHALEDELPRLPALRKPSMTA